MNTDNHCYYYLHTNGDLISKPSIVVDSDPSYFDSPFVKKVWHLDLTDRVDAWKLLLEALALGARINRVKELSIKWRCSLTDFLEMLARIGKPTELMIKGKNIFLSEILGVNPDKFWKVLEDNSSSTVEELKKIIVEETSK